MTNIKQYVYKNGELVNEFDNQYDIIKSILEIATQKAYSKVKYYKKLKYDYSYSTQTAKIIVDFEFKHYDETIDIIRYIYTNIPINNNTIDVKKLLDGLINENLR